MSEAGEKFLRYLALGDWTREGFIEVASQHPTLADRYTVDSLLGFGSTGVVFAARDRVLDRRIAIKCLLPQALIFGVRHQRTLQSFQREAQLLAGLRHPNLCAVYDFGVAADALPWFAMELLEGETLTTSIRRWREDSAGHFSTLLRFAIEIARGIAALHSVGLHQLDVKPENVLVTPDQTIKLIDYATGYERLSTASTAHKCRFGTPEYLAPEIICKDLGKPGNASDVFSLGVSIIEAFCLEHPVPLLLARNEVLNALGIKGRLASTAFTSAPFPFEENQQLDQLGKTYADRLRAFDFRAFVRRMTPELPKELIDLLARMVNVDPSERPQSGSEVEKALHVISQIPPKLTLFISYSHKDKKRFVDPFVKVLKARGINVWYDSSHLHIGESFWDRIGQEVERSTFVVAILSRNSLSLPGFLEELRMARLHNLTRIKVLPILIEDLPFDALPLDLRSRHILRVPLASASRGFHAALDELIRNIFDIGALEEARIE